MKEVEEREEEEEEIGARARPEVRLRCPEITIATERLAQVTVVVVVVDPLKRK